MKIESLIKESLEKFKHQDPELLVEKMGINPHLTVDVAASDIRNKTDVGNYCWFPGFLELFQPSMVIELGSAMGVAALCMLASKHKCEIYGVTLAECNLEFCYIEKNKYPNFHAITGDYMDLSIWPKDVELKKTDFWYIDGLHQGPHVTEQIKLYKPFFKSGTVIAFDDIFMSPDMSEMWHGLDDILDIKYKTTLPLHFTGWGLIQL